MSTETSNNDNSKNQTPVGTVAQPTPIHTGSDSQPPFIISGTLGHTGNVKYSRSAAAVVNETYVVANKK
jgi:hypothetical protein